MSGNLVFTFIGSDRPGLIGRLARVVSDNGGNWLESRMSELAGQFAGIVQVDVAPAQAAALRAALQALSDNGLSVVIADTTTTATSVPASARYLRLAIIGPDRPGIVREVTAALLEQQVNIDEMDTHLSSAPMSAELLFEATAEITVPRDLDMIRLNERLDRIADELTIDIDLEESLR